MSANSPIGPQVRIRCLRQAHGLTLRELAERIAAVGGCRPDADSLANVELGHKRASARLLTTWAKALGVSPLDIYQSTSESDAARDLGRAS